MLLSLLSEAIVFIHLIIYMDKNDDFPPRHNLTEPLQATDGH